MVPMRIVLHYSGPVSRYEHGACWVFVSIIDVGPVMTAKIIIFNGFVVPRSTLHGLKLIDVTHKFDTDIEIKLGL